MNMINLCNFIAFKNADSLTALNVKADLDNEGAFIVTAFFQDGEVVKKAGVSYHPLTFRLPPSPYDLAMHFFKTECGINTDYNSEDYLGPFGRYRQSSGSEWIFRKDSVEAVDISEDVLNIKTVYGFQIPVQIEEDENIVEEFRAFCTSTLGESLSQF